MKVIYNIRKLKVKSLKKSTQDVKGGYKND